VNAEELDIALEELEVRLERLRALYEQYFLGFERIEPAVPRKDVDRRIYVLRREKIRNTGKRFKLQTLIQRYNTFQQYWQRICREIENGTYKRHVLRAERQLSKEQQLTIATRRRFGKSLPPPALEAAAAAAAAAAASSSVPPPSREPATPVLPPRASPPPRLDEALAAGAPQKPAPITSQPPQPKPSPRPSKYESLDLDMGFLGSWAPPPRAIPAPTANTKPEPEPVTPRLNVPPKPRSAPRAADPPAEGRPARAPAAPKPERPPPAAAASSGISEDRVKELHARFVQAKRDNKESGQVSLENLAKTLRDTENKLRAQYKGRKIDFEVVVKDGKTVVKPKVR
jgi:hypothetical protein